MENDSSNSNSTAEARSTDIVEQQIARVYAQALLDAAASSGQEESVVNDLNSLVDDALTQYPQFDALLGTALVGVEEKIGILDRVFLDRASSLMLSFLKVLAQHERLDCLKSIRREVVDLYNVRTNKIPVELVLAAETDEALVGEITEVLCRTLGAEPILEKKIDPSLIAGFLIRVGDQVFDGSTRNLFRKKRDAIVQRSIDLIQTSRERLIEED